MSTIYLQGIAGYYSAKAVYEERTRQLSEAGFIRLQSPPDGEGKSWEVWMLSSPSILAQGPLKGKTEDAIITWCRQLGIGHIEYNGTILGLSLE